MAYLSRQNRVSKHKDWTYPFWGGERKKNEEKLAELKRSVQHHQVYHLMGIPEKEKREKKGKKEYLKK